MTFPKHIREAAAQANAQPVPKRKVQASRLRQVAGLIQTGKSRIPAPVITYQFPVSGKRQLMTGNRQLRTLPPINNPALFDAVFSAIGASNGAWLKDTVQADYIDEMNAALTIAIEVDSLIPAISGGATISQRELIQSIVAGVMADKFPTTTSTSFYSQIAQSIAAKFNQFSTQLQDPDTGHGSGTATALATTGSPVNVSSSSPPSDFDQTLLIDSLDPLVANWGYQYDFLASFPSGVDDVPKLSLDLAQARLLGKRLQLRDATYIFGNSADPSTSNPLILQSGDRIVGAPGGATRISYYYINNTGPYAPIVAPIVRAPGTISLSQPAYSGSLSVIVGTDPALLEIEEGSLIETQPSLTWTVGGVSGSQGLFQPTEISTVLSIENIEGQFVITLDTPLAAELYVNEVRCIDNTQLSVPVSEDVVCYATVSPLSPVPTVSLPVAVKFTTGGFVGTAGIFYEVSYDWGTTWSSATALGTNETITFAPLGGVIIELTHQGSIKTGIIFTFQTVLASTIQRVVSRVKDIEISDITFSGAGLTEILLEGVSGALLSRLNADDSVDAPYSSFDVETSCDDIQWNDCRTTVETPTTSRVYAYRVISSKNITWNDVSADGYLWNFSFQGGSTFLEMFNPNIVAGLLNYQTYGIDAGGAGKVDVWGGVFSGAWANIYVEHSGDVRLHGTTSIGGSSFGFCVDTTPGFDPNYIPSLFCENCLSIEPNGVGFGNVSGGTGTNGIAYPSGHMTLVDCESRWLNTTAGVTAFQYAGTITLWDVLTRCKANGPPTAIAFIGSGYADIIEPVFAPTLTCAFENGEVTIQGVRANIFDNSISCSYVDITLRDWRVGTFANACISSNGNNTIRVEDIESQRRSAPSVIFIVSQPTDTIIYGRHVNPLCFYSLLGTPAYINNGTNQLNGTIPVTIDFPLFVHYDASAGNHWSYQPKIQRNTPATVPQNSGELSWSGTNGVLSVTSSNAADNGTFNWVFE